MIKLCRIAKASSKPFFILMDGQIYPEWIESLNSTLDDNRLLTLKNGERITFESRINFIFETDSLDYASPATISRLGIINLNGQTLDFEQIIQQK